MKLFELKPNYSHKILAEYDNKFSKFLRLLRLFSFLMGSSYNDRIKFSKLIINILEILNSFIYIKTLINA